MGTPFIPVPIGAFIRIISSEGKETEETEEKKEDCGLAIRYPQAFERSEDD